MRQDLFLDPKMTLWTNVESEAFTHAKQSQKIETSTASQTDDNGAIPVSLDTRKFRWTGKQIFGHIGIIQFTLLLHLAASFGTWWCDRQTHRQTTMMLPA